MLTFEYDIKKFGELPAKLNGYLDGSPNHDWLLVKAQGVEPSNPQALGIYQGLAKTFRLPLVFYPYCEVASECNRVFNRPNPLAKVQINPRLSMQVVRSPNPGWFILNLEHIRRSNVRFVVDFPAMFFELFIVDLAKSGVLPSNGIFIDVPDSWQLFPKYEGGQIMFDREIKMNDQRRIEAMNIKIDNSTQNIINHMLKHLGGQ